MIKILEALMELPEVSLLPAVMEKRSPVEERAPALSQEDPHLSEGENQDFSISDQDPPDLEPEALPSVAQVSGVYLRR